MMSPKDRYPGSIFDPPSLHKYSYAGANPVNYTDPTGYFSLGELEAGQVVDSIIASMVAGYNAWILSSFFRSLTKVELNQMVVPPKKLLDDLITDPGGIRPDDLLGKNTILVEVLLATKLVTVAQILDTPAIRIEDGWEILLPDRLLEWQSIIQTMFEAGDKGEAEAKLPNQGTVKGDVENAPPVDAGKQGKHVKGHSNYKEGNSTWEPGNTGVHDTQEAWLNGQELPDGTKVWDAGKTTGTNGETGVRVHIDRKGNIHGYPVVPGRYLPRQ